MKVIIRISITIHALAKRACVCKSNESSLRHKSLSVRQRWNSSHFGLIGIVILLRVEPPLAYSPFNAARI
jgi:hypothetical protein